MTDNFHQLDLAQTSYTYSGDLYWSNKSEFDEYTNFQLTTGYRKKEIEQPEIIINGKIFTKGGTKIIDKPEYLSLKIYSPAIRYNWESSRNNSHSVSKVLLAPWLVELLDLKFDPTNLNYSDSEGSIAVMYVNQKGETYSNTKELIYLRKDLVDILIRKKGLELMWITQGERSYSSSENLHSINDASIKYKEFNHIEMYHN
ncbi:MAG: hypothetical protein QM504_05310 [Pseudomonadota bacterium]